MIPNENGGAIDDAYLYRFFSDSYLLVVNASNREKDWRHMQEAMAGFSDVRMEDRTFEMAMISLQGPASKDILSPVLSKGRLPEPMRNKLSVGSINDIDVLIARTGYTGEPLCFELFIDAGHAGTIWDLFLERGAAPIGLGARDTLRLEAGLPLYGHELGDHPENKGGEIPIYACPLARFAVSFSPLKGEFIGRAALLRQYDAWRRITEGAPGDIDNLPQIVMPVAIEGKGIARNGYRVLANENPVGVVTSGTMVPYWVPRGQGVSAAPGETKASRPIALALLDSRLRTGDKVEIEIRNRKVAAAIAPYFLRSEAPPYARAILSFEREARVPQGATDSQKQYMDKAGALVGKALEEADVFYYQGADFISEVETLLVEELKQFLGCREAENPADLRPDGQWAKKELMGIGLTGKTLGIIGMGRIGCELAKRAQAFDMKVVAYQRSVDPERYEKMGVKPVSLEVLLKKADFVSLHVPKSKETDKLIGKKELSWMKSTAYLLNTARGTVIDESALLEALESGVIAGAGLDVYAKEPAVDSRLAKHPRVIATPHIAASTTEAQAAAATTVAEKIINVLSAGLKLDNPLSLRVVDIKDVVKHELIDPRRVEKLKETLKKAEVFTNPPIVAEDRDKYILLDGATRTTAMKELGFDHMVVQVISNLNDCQLDTWQHVIRKVDSRKIIDLLDAMPEITLVETPGGDVLEKMADHGGLCYMITINEKCYHIQPAPGVNHLDALYKLTNAYIEASVVTRTSQRDIGELVKAYPDMAALMVFPKYDPQQVIQIAHSGRALPAGITRFLIPGRVMRLNVRMDILKTGSTLQEKNQWLYQFTMDKLDHDKARLYQEPVYLLDE